MRKREEREMDWTALEARPHTRWKLPAPRTMLPAPPAEPAEPEAPVVPVHTAKQHLELKKILYRKIEMRIWKLEVKSKCKLFYFKNFKIMLFKYFIISSV